MNELDEFKLFSKTLAFESGKIIKKYFRKKITIETKLDASPVTIADKLSEEVMRELIIKYFPDHGILGEEFGSYNPHAEYMWMLDPIDGTKSFICGVPIFGTVISLLKNGNPILGTVHNPILEELIIGDNINTRLNEEQVFFRDCQNLSDAILLTTDHANYHKFQNFSNFERLYKSVKLYRTWGECYAYYLLASGFADIMLDPIMSPWDTMALIPIIKGSGGIITDYEGEDPSKGNSIIASSKNLHSVVLKILKGEI